MSTLNAHEVSALLVPVLMLPLDLMGEHDPQTAERIRAAVRALELAIADERRDEALVSARRLFTLLMAAWGRGLVEYDDLEGLIDLLALLAAALSPKYTSARRR